MDINKILSADLLDLIFDNRNKEYGAYELRKNYHTRITKSLIFTGVFASLIFTGVVLANKLNPKEVPKWSIRPDVTISSFRPEEKPQESIPEPPKKIVPPQVRTEQLTHIKIAPDVEVTQPPPTQTALEGAVIDVVKRAGTDFDGIIVPQNLDVGKDIIEKKIGKESEGPRAIIDIPAKFDGDWIRFLERNLDGQVAVDNNAPAGKYTVVMQFVVDVDGTISDIKPLSSLGYGLEQEAIRVLRKAKKWNPAIYDGRPVKAYRRQPISFLVTEE